MKDQVYGLYGQGLGVGLAADCHIGLKAVDQSIQTRVERGFRRQAQCEIRVQHSDLGDSLRARVSQFLHVSRCRK